MIFKQGFYIGVGGTFLGLLCLAILLEDLPFTVGRAFSRGFWSQCSVCGGVVWSLAKETAGGVEDLRFGKTKCPLSLADQRLYRELPFIQKVKSPLLLWWAMKRRCKLCEMFIDILLTSGGCLLSLSLFRNHSQINRNNNYAGILVFVSPSNVLQKDWYFFSSKDIKHTLEQKWLSWLGCLAFAWMVFAKKPEFLWPGDLT